VKDSPIIKRTDIAWVAYLVAAIVLVLAVAVLIGMALSSLSFPWGPVVALIMVVLAAGLLVPELRSFWARLPR
jgi:nicotinamide riboside transporter PnuC